ncbi:hypothetical protein MJD09_00255, partial [bacterium]|nr:hypothetical protein [bacterium]
MNEPGTNKPKIYAQQLTEKYIPVRIMELQCLSVKLYTNGGTPPALADFVPVFHSWIQTNQLDELLIDVAVYSHVPAGAGVLLIGHEANYSVEYGPEERFGLVYQVKRPQPGSNRERLVQALHRVACAAFELQNQPQFADRLRFANSNLRLTVKRRSVAPNEPITLAHLSPDLAAVFDRYYGAGGYSLTSDNADPRECFSIVISSEMAHDLAELFQSSA